MYDSVPADKWVVVARRLMAIAAAHDASEPAPAPEREYRLRRADRAFVARPMSDAV